MFVVNPKKSKWAIGKVIEYVGNNIMKCFTSGGFRKFVLQAYINLALYFGPKKGP